MAINQENIGLDIAARAVTAAGNLQQAINELDDLLAWAVGAGISDLDQFNAAFEASGDLKHVNGTTIEKLVANVIPSLKTYLSSTSQAGETYQQIINKTRRK